MKIENPPESTITNTEFSPELLDQFLSRSAITRGDTSYVYIPKPISHNVPQAFVEWKDKLQQGEKFPQGKYFRQQETIRRWLNSINTKNVKYTTLHVD